MMHIDILLKTAEEKSIQLYGIRDIKVKGNYLTMKKGSQTINYPLENVVMWVVNK
jgi:uncharacterized Zn ribbon protein